MFSLKTEIVQILKIKKKEKNSKLLNQNLSKPVSYSVCVSV